MMKDLDIIIELYGIEPPADSAEREELVKNLMAEAVENDAGRPSVEAPLHNVFEARYAAYRRLFPDALWVEYIDPGYTLCMEVRERIVQYMNDAHREFIENWEVESYRQQQV